MEKDTKSQVYQDALDAYKEAVVKAPTLSFTAFCRQNNVPRKGMQHWLDRKNIRISEVRTHTLQEHGYVSSIPTKKCTSQSTEYQPWLESPYRKQVRKDGSCRAKGKGGSKGAWQ